LVKFEYWTDHSYTFALFDPNDATTPTPTSGTGTPSVFYIYQTFYTYTSISTDDILVDLVSAYGNPIKMSFSVVNSENKLYIYLLVAGDFGVSYAAKIAKY
jgi:hypothetical protein